MNFNDLIPSNNGKPSGGIDAFDATEAAPDFAPVPAGTYTANVQRGEVCQTKTGVDAYRIRFRIVEGPYAGRTVIRTWTFSERALPYTKRDLAAFGLTTSAALLAQFPPASREYRVRLVVALQRGDDGVDRNDIKRIDVIGVTDSPIADFVLPSEQAKGGADV